jgi:photosynthetic reaction center cytochrome c subunit
MKVGSSRTIVGVMGATTVVWLLGVALASGQAAQAPRPQMSEEVFKNIQVLKGVPVNDFMGIMGIFSASLGMSCEDCHAADDRNWAGFAVDNAKKRTARRMILMVQEINRANFGGRPLVSCFSCHRGADRPKVTVDLAQLYGAPAPENPSQFLSPAPLAPAADEVLDKYLQAIGGAQRLAAVTSFTATGTSSGYGPEAQGRPVEIFAKAPGQRTTIIHSGNGDIITTLDGKQGWISAPLRPVPVVTLTGKDLDAANLDAILAFPAKIKEALIGWRVGYPAVIDDREVQVLQASTPAGALVTLYFDAESGLLVRQLRHIDSPVGPITTQADYADYREVSGIKMPYRWTMTWLDGRDVYELKQVQMNAAIDAAKFARPPAPAAARAPR